MDEKQDTYALSWIEPRWEYTATDFKVFPTEMHPRSVAEVVNWENTSPQWIYPPQVERVYRDTLGPSIMFMLPPTHYISFSEAINDSELCDFAVSALGFFLGLNLKPSGMGHLHRTPRTMGSLVNFVDVGRDLERAMNSVISFFLTNNARPEVIPLMSAAIHWYLTSQSYHHAFEQFFFQYSVLDNIHRVTTLLHPGYRSPHTVKGGDNHSLRPLRMAGFYDIPLPPEFSDSNLPSPNARKLASARNSLVHEARWLGQPLGYAVDQTSWEMLLNLKNFNSQLILAAFGIECEFRKRLYCRQTLGLDVRL